MTSPEYKCISDCRDSLTGHLSSCLEDVASPLRQSSAITDTLYDKITKNAGREGAEVFVNHFLVCLKSHPMESFVEFVSAMKKHGDKYFKAFVIQTIETNRKKLYRELFQVQPGCDSEEYDVFISYSHDNCTLQVVDNDLKPQLTQEGLRVFIDRGSIKPGDIWPAEIASAIHTCKAFVVVLTKRYVSSVYCNGELYEAEALDKRLFPVVCETGWEEETGGRPVADIVRAVQSVSLVTEHKETELARLVKAIKDAVHTSAVAVPNTLHTRPNQANGAVPAIATTIDFTAWKSKLGAKLEQEIEDKDLCLIAQMFDDMEPYVDQLGLRPGERTDAVRKAAISGTSAGMTMALSTWKSHSAWHATYRALLDILLKLRKESVARELCEFLDNLQC